MGREVRAKLVTVTGKLLLTSVMMLSSGLMQIKLQKRMNMKISRKSWKVCVTLSFPRCTKVQEGLKEEECLGEHQGECQEVHLVEDLVVLQDKDPLLKKLTKLMIHMDTNCYLLSFYLFIT